MPSIGQNMLDLLQACLQFNPNRRITAAEALRHPHLSQFHNPDDEPTAAHVAALPLDDSVVQFTSDYRDQIYASVLQLPRAQQILRNGADYLDMLRREQREEAAEQELERL